MTYPEQWKALSARIHGLMQAAQLDARYLAVRSSDTYGRAKRLREHGDVLISALRSFQDRFKHSLPPAALDSIDRFLASTGSLLSDKSGTRDAMQERVWTGLVLLGAFETELSFVLSDLQEVIHARSERAFDHLQRSIVADATLRKKWRDAFAKGEIACEQLGAVHLLQHGIWAFKVNAAGARTDLVYQEPVADLNQKERYVDGLVLTEWKKAQSESQATTQFSRARTQIQQYSKGLLAGNELTSYRFAVVVTEQQIRVPEDVMDGGVIFRHINIAVDPRPPSRH